MKNRFFLYVAMMVAGLLCFSSCINDAQEYEEEKPLNISIYLDLSDRLGRNELVPSQYVRDTTIVSYITDYFIKNTLGPKILQSKNRMRVLFYPTPKDPEIALLAKGLSVDVGSKIGIEKRKSLEAMREEFPKNLSSIYDQTIRAKNWIGADIWGFFSDSMKVDQLCIRPDSRNIIVILTDGYLFYQPNMVKEGVAYSYVTSSTLSVPGSSLIDKRNGSLQGKGVEVLMLEINPYDIKHEDKMKQILTDWFHAMGVEKFVVAETDANLTSTENIIDNFLSQQ